MTLNYSLRLRVSPWSKYEILAQPVSVRCGLLKAHFLTGFFFKKKVQAHKNANGYEQFVGSGLILTALVWPFQSNTHVYVTSQATMFTNLVVLTIFKKQIVSKSSSFLTLLPQ